MTPILTPKIKIKIISFKRFQKDFEKIQRSFKVEYL